MRQTTSFPRVKLPTEPIEDGNDPSDGLILDADGNIVVAPVEAEPDRETAFWTFLSRNFNMPGPHSQGHAGQRGKAITRRRAKNRVAKASRRANR